MIRDDRELIGDGKPALAADTEAADEFIGPALVVAGGAVAQNERLQIVVGQPVTEVPPRNDRIGKSGKGYFDGPMGDAGRDMGVPGIGTVLAHNCELRIRIHFAQHLEDLTKVLRIDVVGRDLFGLDRGVKHPGVGLLDHELRIFPVRGFIFQTNRAGCGSGDNRCKISSALRCHRSPC